jgi:hypothetical protein
MPSFFELYDLRSGNVIASFASEDEAWDALRNAAREFGLEELEELALSHVQDDSVRLIAMDDDLARRVAIQLNSETARSDPVLRTSA